MPSLRHVYSVTATGCHAAVAMGRHLLALLITRDEAWCQRELGVFEPRIVDQVVDLGAPADTADRVHRTGPRCENVGEGVRERNVCRGDRDAVVLGEDVRCIEPASA